MKKSLILALCCSGMLNMAFAQPTDPTQAPKVDAFSLTPDNLGAITNAVNLFTGDLNLPLNVLKMPAKGGLVIDIPFVYNSNVQYVVDIWNKDAPTSVLGMGWSVPRLQVVADNKMTGVREDDEYFLIEPEGSVPLICIGNDNGVKSYATARFSNWKITFTMAEEKWEIIKDDGVKMTFGDMNSGRNTVQWIVKWGNWIGDSGLATGQQRQGFIWDISEIRSVWNDRLLFTYEVTERTVGPYGLYHTEASYLKKVSDTWGNEVEVVNASKLPDEYMEPHPVPQEPDAYQERYETKFIDKLLIKNKNIVYEEVHFGYQTNLLGVGNLTKRLLTSLTKVNSAGETMNVLSFQYKTSGWMRGAMDKITTPLGGSVTFGYEPSPNLALLNRQITCYPPPGYSEPRVWVEADYTVVTWRRWDGGSHDGSESLKIQIYTWEGGRWILKELEPVLEVGISSQLQTFKLATGKDFFGLIEPAPAANTYGVRLFKRNPAIPGDWLMTMTSLDFGSHDGDKAQIDCGDNYIGITGNRGRLFAYTWTGTEWRLKTFQEENHGHDTGFGHNYILSHYTWPSNDDFKMYVLDEQNMWLTVEQDVTYNNEDGSAHWYPGKSFAFTRRSGGNEYTFRWDENYTFFTPFNMGYNTEDPKVFISNAAVTLNNGGDDPWMCSHRWDGLNWRSSGKKTRWGPGESHSGDDVFTWANFNGTSQSRYSAWYNPNTYSWTTTTYQQENSWETLQGILGDDVFMSNHYYHKDDFGNVTRYEITPQAGEYDFDLQKIRVPSKNYILRGYYPSRVAHIRNGKLDPAIPVETISGTFFGKRDTYSYWNVTYFDGPNSVLTTPLYWDQFIESPGLSLYRIANFKAKGSEIDYPIKRIAINDGNGKITYHYIDYDYSKALFDETMQVARYNKVTFYEGTESSSSAPHGSTEYYFFNGLSPDALGESFPQIVNDNYGLLTGTAYRTLVKKSNGTIVSSTVPQYEVVYKSIVNASGYTTDRQYVVRRKQVISTTDNVPSVTEYEYDFSTQQVRAITSYAGVPGGATSPKMKVEYKYGWEVYAKLQELNMLVPIVQTTKFKNNVAYASTATRWKNWNTSSDPSGTLPSVYDSYMYSGQGAPAAFPDFSMTQTEVANWALVGRTLQRDYTSGLALEGVGPAGQRESFLFDETNRNVVATVKNASYTDISYWGVEDYASGNFLFKEVTRVVGDAPTGAAYGMLGNGTGLMKAPMDPQKRYVVSFWAKAPSGGSMSIDGVGSIPITNTEWTYYEYEVTARSSMMMKRTSSLPVFIDEVRIYPVNASMTTNSYHPVFGVISQTDDNNQSVHTTYDKFGRKLAILNDNRDIIKLYQYNIKQP